LKSTVNNPQRKYCNAMS